MRKFRIVSANPPTANCHQCAEPNQHIVPTLGSLFHYPPMHVNTTLSNTAAVMRQLSGVIRSVCSVVWG